MRLRYQSLRQFLHVAIDDAYDGGWRVVVVITDYIGSTR